MIRPLSILLFLLIASPRLAFSANPPPAYREDAVKSDYFGFDRYDFALEGRKCYIIEPAEALPGKPWIWRARFDSKVFPNFDKAMLAEGYHVAKTDAGGLYGNVKAMEIFDDFYAELTGKYGFNAKPNLEGLSRGGLPIFNWAAGNLEKVSCVYADAAVCDFKSWPGGKGKGKGAPAQWEQCLKEYGLTDAEATNWKGNPVDNIHLLAKAKVPVIFVAGGADPVVPPEENALIMEKRYNAALPAGGIPMKIILKPGVGHHPHGLEDPSEVVAFVKKATKP